MESKYPDYSSFKLELLALKWAVVDKFRDYLLGVPFTVLTDNNPLSYLRTAKLGACEMRWVAQLAAFTFEVKFRSGVSNRCADALSRYPGHSSHEETEEIMQNKVNSTIVQLGRVNLRKQSHVEPTGEGNERAVGPPGVFPSWTSEQLAALQKADPTLRFIWKRWDDKWKHGETYNPAQGEPDEVKFWLWQWPRIVQRDGVLYRRVTDPLRGELDQILLPKSLQAKAVTGCHDKWGHQGVARTCSLLRRRVYWPKMAAAVRKHVGNCRKCIIGKAAEPQARTPMRHLIAFKPLEVLAIDFVKVDRGHGGCEDVLVMTDVFTKFVQAVPCRNQLAVTVAKALRDHWFTKFGIPHRLHSDQGRNFEGDVVRELCALYGVKKTRTTPYHPEGNAQAERFNRTMFGLIRSIDECDRRKWPAMLPHLVFVYNTTPHCTTGVAPYTLMFGREPAIPLDQMLGRAGSSWDQEFVHEQSRLLGRAGDLVRERVVKRGNQNKRAHDSKVNAKPIGVGSRVLKRKLAFSGRHKLQDKYEHNLDVVTWVNEYEDVYKIRPMTGGPEVTINRKYLRKDPMTESDSESENPSDESDDDIHWAVASEPTENLAGVDSEEVGEPPGGSDSPLPMRRSLRADKGTHSNPYHLPRSVLS